MRPDIPTLRLREPVDILAALPYVVGYHPSDSIVVLGMIGRRLVFAARDDLPPAGAAGPDVGAAVDHLVGIVLRQDCTSVIIVGVGAADRVDPVAHGLLDAYRLAGLAVQEVLRADKGRYRSLLCTNPGCCPVDGKPYDPTTTEIAARWTFAGMVARRDRAEFEAQLQPVTGPARDAIRAATEVAHRQLHKLLLSAPDEKRAHASILKAGRAAVEAAFIKQREGARLDDEDVAWLSVILMDDGALEAGWTVVLDSGDDAEDHQTLWTDVVRRCEADLVSGPATLLGFSAWRAGDGGMARMALERALAEDPTNRLAEELLRALSCGTPPWAWDSYADNRLRRPRGSRRSKRSSSRRAGSRRG